ncbi:ATPase family AAA domain-containing protein 5b isoform X2 [Hemibagrus wyckioides]|uniref:ATPase family AAA domain-containing protein 5b isoform X2 n=1 Tax=Hemibagrus wyckioides TaxID=337641 RepID=UPI00266B93D9|nr:ATPase family AAA domain-containing protein 5b isoform X2 [Hemibagrus wyckioides]
MSVNDVRKMNSISSRKTSCNEKSPSVQSSCISPTFTGVKAEKIQLQEQTSTEKPKINRLKRANRIRKSDLLWRECQVIRPDVTDDDDDDDKCPNRGLLLHTKTPLGQNQLKVKSSTSCHRRSSVLGDEAGSLRSGAHAGRSSLCRHEESESENNTAVHSYSRSTPPSQSHPGSSEFFTDAHTREEFLKQVHAQNPRFPVRRLVQTLLKRLVSHFPIGENKISPVVTATGKRKQEVESHSDGCLRKRRRSIQGDSVTENVSEGHVSSGHGAMSRNRLRRKPAPVQNAAVDESHQGERHVRHDHDVENDDDVPWTEKYRPRSSEEVVGNSASVRKLYSWLKEWRIRADVEERRKRREEHRMKEKSDGSWDCGDFEGDPLMEECEGELCNTLLIHGPTGAGKSAAVFACAEQLGFKVLEVNSSSLRSGRLVLSQLRESTQSHQVGAPQHCASLTHTPAAASQALQRFVSSNRRPSGAASRKRRVTAQKSLMLTHYFIKPGTHVNKHSELPQDTRAADEVTRVESEMKKDDAVDKKCKASPISLILFEEVDIVFQEDVGFLAAVKSLMSTTKRPIILTTNDPSFGESFEGRFQEVHFKTPATESVVSYLQCVCVVHGVKPDPEHIRFMLQEHNGDVRGSVLELELWARSGAGNTHHHLHNRALSCRSYAELEISGSLDVLVESWRKGRSLFYSNLDLLLATPTVEKADQSTIDEKTNPARFQNQMNKDTTPPDSRKPSGLKVKMNSALQLDRLKHTDQSAGFSEVETLARFLDTVSFADSCLSRQPCCKSGPLGATMADGLLDEPREDEEVEKKTLSLERCYEILAVVEALGFLRCRMEVCPAERADRDVRRGDETRKIREQKCAEVAHRVLCSEAFRCHGDQTAVLTDYLPCLRFICREQRVQQRPKLRISHYLRDIGLRLPKNVLDLLASPLR